MAIVGGAVLQHVQFSQDFQPTYPSILAISYVHAFRSDSSCGVAAWFDPSFQLLLCHMTCLTCTNFPYRSRRHLGRAMVAMLITCRSARCSDTTALSLRIGYTRLRWLGTVFERLAPPSSRHPPRGVCGTCSVGFSEHHRVATISQSSTRIKAPIVTNRVHGARRSVQLTFHMRSVWFCMAMNHYPVQSTTRLAPFGPQTGISCQHGGRNCPCLLVLPLTWLQPPDASTPVIYRRRCLGSVPTNISIHLRFASFGGTQTWRLQTLPTTRGQEQ